MYWRKLVIIKEYNFLKTGFYRVADFFGDADFFNGRSCKDNKVGDAANTRILSKISEKIIDFAAGTGKKIDQIKSAAMPRRKMLRSNEMKLAVMPNNEVQGVGVRRNARDSKEAKEFMASTRKGKGYKKGKCEGGNWWYWQNLKDTHFFCRFE